ncbi:hypothetical protein M758_10G163700 [Ceratodon purpureus]|uniref:Secreted protein n=1 Tax=Ceratodon purpureus TaxID=3225 RepID=A0A8T0GMV3_CERPU|nr:hypothetical protein KC19_10G168400 [Ceratodon purpureus]KAG0604334.1 hypothetical protein M758_10G163700 [Ceratodon purpureus]
MLVLFVLLICDTLLRHRFERGCHWNSRRFNRMLNHKYDTVLWIICNTTFISWLHEEQNWALQVIQLRQVKVAMALV